MDYYLKHVLQFHEVNINYFVIMCTYECTLLFLRRLLLLAFENGGRGGLNPQQTGNKLNAQLFIILRFIQMKIMGGGVPSGVYFYFQ